MKAFQVGSVVPSCPVAGVPCMVSLAPHVQELCAGLWDPGASRCHMNIFRATVTTCPCGCSLCTPAEGAVVSLAL